MKGGFDVISRAGEWPGPVVSSRADGWRKAAGLTARAGGAHPPTSRAVILSLDFTPWRPFLGWSLSYDSPAPGARCCLPACSDLSRAPKPCPAKTAAPLHSGLCTPSHLFPALFVGGGQELLFVVVSPGVVALEQGCFQEGLLCAGHEGIRADLQLAPRQMVGVRVEGWRKVGDLHPLNPRELL